MIRACVLVLLLGGCIDASQPQPPAQGTAVESTQDSSTSIPPCESSQEWTAAFTLPDLTVRVLGSGLGGYIYDDRTVEPGTSSLGWLVQWNQTAGVPRLRVDVVALDEVDGPVLVAGSGDSPLVLALEADEMPSKVRIRTQTENTTVGPVTAGASGPLVIHYTMTEIGPC
jgi:hypothetical protein